jgi:hypothetical protein
MPPKDVTYEHLPKSERATIIRARLGTLERDHFQAAMDAKASGIPLDQENHPQRERLDSLAETIADLKAQLADLEKKS